MHVPDGFLDAKVAGATALVSLGGVWGVLRRVEAVGGGRKVPLMGVCAAFIFIAQMVNFPVAAGTSGHLVGAALATVLLGPSAAVVVMTAVLVVQALLFADGGVLALGANVLNMALVAVGTAALVQRLAARAWPGQRGLYFATALAGWSSIVAASAVCAVELGVSGAAPLGLALSAMTGVHLVIGLGEGLISTLVVAAVARARPDLVSLPGDARARGSVGWVLVAGLVGLGLVPLASRLPDGLERVAEELGFSGRATEPLSAPLVVTGAGPSIVVAAIGAAVAFALAWLLARTLARGHERPSR